MEEPKVFADNLFYVWGFHGLLLVDAMSYTDAQEMYCTHHGCSISLVEHVMLVPDPESWATRQPWPAPTAHNTQCNDDHCQQCRIEFAAEYFPTTEVDPTDPRVAWINLEADKAAVDARSDQLRAHGRETGRGYLYGKGLPKGDET